VCVCVVLPTEPPFPIRFFPIRFTHLQMLRALSGLRRVRPFPPIPSRAGSSHAPEGGHGHHDAGHLSAGAAAYETQIPRLWGAAVSCRARLFSAVYAGGVCVGGGGGGREGGE
jgi:hypothetical protein